LCSARSSRASTHPTSVARSYWLAQCLTPSMHTPSPGRAQPPHSRSSMRHRPSSLATSISPLRAGQSLSPSRRSPTRTASSTSSWRPTEQRTFRARRVPSQRYGRETSPPTPRRSQNARPAKRWATQPKRWPKRTASQGKLKTSLPSDPMPRPSKHSKRGFSTTR